jgi:hypothetical protein
MKNRSKMWMKKQINEFNNKQRVFERWNESLKKIIFHSGNLLVN